MMLYTKIMFKAITSSIKIALASYKLTMGTVVSKPPIIAEALLGRVVNCMDINARALPIAITFILTLI